MKKNAKRIFAVIAICLLLALYITTLVSAIIGSEAAINLFRSCVYGTIAIPILLWIFISIFKYLNRNNTNIEEQKEENKEIEN